MADINQQHNSFNSITVQLRQLQPNVLTHPTVFQFHNGTIKTKHLFGVRKMLRSFNSITVQLRR